jgi:hypothetical protein
MPRVPPVLLVTTIRQGSKGPALEALAGRLDRVLDRLGAGVDPARGPALPAECP